MMIYYDRITYDLCVGINSVRECLDDVLNSLPQLIRLRNHLPSHPTNLIPKHQMHLITSLIPNRIVLPIVIIRIDLTQPLMHSKVVQRDIRNNPLLNLRAISIGEVVGVGQFGDFGVSVEALTDGGVEGAGEVVDEVFEADDVGDGALGGFVEDLPDEDHDLVGGVVVDAGDDGGGVLEFVLFEDAVEHLLDGLFVGDLGEGGAEDLVEVACALEAGVVVFSCVPGVITVDEPFVDGGIVKGHVGDDLLFGGIWVVGVDVVEGEK